MRSWYLVLLLGWSVHTALAQDTLTLAEADTLVAHEEWKSARKLYEKVINAGNAPANAYYQRARCSRMLGFDWKVIFTDLGEALRLEPHHYRALAMRGEAYYENLMFDRSVDDLSDALAHAPDTTARVHCLTERGSSYSAQREFDTAVKDFRAALELDSNAHSAYGRLANALDELGQHEEALRMQIRYTELVPEDFTGYMNVGFYMGEAGHYDDALGWYEKAWAHAGKNEQALVLNNRGYVKYKLGDHPGALKDIRKSIELRAWNSYAYRNLALVLIAQGEVDDACTALERAKNWGFTQQYGNEVDQLYRTHCK